MDRPQLEHVLRAAAGITGADRWVVIGSQAVLGQFASPPAELLQSVEADLFSLRSEADAQLVDGSIGEQSQFHRTFGYYAHGVGIETARLPAGWRDRLVPLKNVNTGGATGLCLEVHDLAVSKLVAGRPKDLEYVGVLLKARLASKRTLIERLAQTTLSDSERELCEGRIQRIGVSDA